MMMIFKVSAHHLNVQCFLVTEMGGSGSGGSMSLMEGRTIFDLSSIPWNGEESLEQAKVCAQGGVSPIEQILLGVPGS